MARHIAHRLMNSLPVLPGVSLLSLFHEPLASSKLKPIKAHGNYGCGLYEGLGIAFK